MAEKPHLHNVGIAALKEAFAIIVDGAVATGALLHPAIATALPTAAIKTGSFGKCRIRFGGTDAENETVNYQVVLWTKFTSSAGDCYIPLVVASGVATFGGLTYGVGTVMGATGNFLCDTITDTLSFDGVTLTSQANNTIAELEIDIRNAHGVEVQTDIGTAASADVFMQLIE